MGNNNLIVNGGFNQYGTSVINNVIKFTGSGFESVWTLALPEIEASKIKPDDNKAVETCRLIVLADSQTEVKQQGLVSVAEADYNTMDTQLGAFLSMRQKFDDKGGALLSQQMVLKDQQARCSFQGVDSVKCIG